MEATEILKSALVKLQNMTPKEVQERSKLKGIKIEEGTGNSDFTIDLQGMMPEAINSK
jgi:hypothetical protein